MGDISVCFEMQKGKKSESGQEIPFPHNLNIFTGMVKTFRLLYASKKKLGCVERSIIFH